MWDEFIKMFIINICLMDFNYYLFKSGGVNIILLKFDFKFFKYIYKWRVLLRE